MHFQTVNLDHAKGRVVHARRVFLAVGEEKVSIPVPKDCVRNYLDTLAVGGYTTVQVAEEHHPGRGWMMSFYHTTENK